MSDATIQEQAIAWLQRGGLDAGLKAAAIAIVPTMPTRPEGMPYCRACESVLCGACGQCHSLDLLPGDGYCRADQDTMGADCAAWFQAYNAVFTMARQQEEREQPDQGAPR
jgi:hypothetical protein